MCGQRQALQKVRGRKGRAACGVGGAEWCWGRCVARRAEARRHFVLFVPCWALPAAVLLLQVYGQGSGRDCRLHVQKLNLLQGEAEEAAARTAR